mgnify:FL=1
MVCVSGVNYFGREWKVQLWEVVLDRVAVVGQVVFVAMCSVFETWDLENQPDAFESGQLPQAVERRLKSQGYYLFP